MKKNAFILMLCLALVPCLFPASASAEQKATVISDTEETEPEKGLEEETQGLPSRPHTLSRARTRSVASGTYTLAAGASQLKAGDEIILVSDDWEYFYAMGSGFGGIQATVNGMSLEAPAGTEALTLVEAEGGWLLSTGSAYLSASGSSLTTVSDAENASVWTISIANEVATISTSGGAICYDGTAFYFGSGGNQVAIYCIPKGQTFNITWKDYDGTILATITVQYGALPVYPNEPPIREKDTVYTYTFTGWTPEVVAATKDTSYTAVYDAIARKKCGPDLYWEFDATTGTLTIDGIGPMSNYTDSLAPWYSYRTRITHVVFPDGLTSIGSNAFCTCTEITCVTIPNGVISISTRAFAGCSSLTSIIIPESVTVIHDNAFASCSSLASITIPDSVTSIFDSAFNGCSKLYSISIPNSVTTIGALAFYGTGWWNEQSDGLLYLDNCLIGHKGSLSQQILTVNAGTRVIADRAFDGQNTITKVKLPESVKTIGDYAFSRCTNLSSLIIGDGVSRIDMYAFSGCTGLTSITLPCSLYLYPTIFENCTNITSVHLTKGTGVWATSDYRNSPWYLSSRSVVTVVLDEGIENIGDSAFRYCSHVTSITIPDSVTSIGDYTFAWCTGLTSVTIPNSVTSIGEDAFYYCTGLTSVTIPDSVTNISRWAFAYCSGLTNITIPDSIISIGQGAFQSCAGLTSVTIGNSVTSIGGSAFHNCTGLTSVNIPDSVTSIGSSAFSGCSGLTSVTIPDSVISIGSNAFSGCTGLTDVYYNGTAAQRAKIQIDDGNDPLLSATWHYLPMITKQPNSVTVYVGKKATFKVVASDATAYQWQYKKPGSTSWTNVSKNGTAATYTLTAKAAHDGYTYRCEVTNEAGSVYSEIVTLTVLVKPTVTTNPASVTVTAGAKATFTVVATGATSYKWQYQKPGATSWTNVSKNGTSATYTLTTKSSHDGYTYRCKVTNEAGSVYSEAATLTVLVKPTITTQPKAVTVYVGQTATFTVVAIDAESYKWQYQKPGSSTWTDVSKNGTAATYSLTTAAKHDGYSYRCAVKNAVGTVYSNAVKLTVSVKPVITTQPKAASVTAGKKATFKVVADGATSYQWQYQKPGSSTWTNVSKSGTSATYSLTTAAKLNGYKYRCAVTNDKGTVYSEAATLTVN